MQISSKYIKFFAHRKLFSFISQICTVRAKRFFSIKIHLKYYIIAHADVAVIMNEIYQTENITNHLKK